MDHLYNQYLSLCVKHLGNGITNNFQLDIVGRMALGTGPWAGVHMADKVGSVLSLRPPGDKKRRYMIANLDYSSEPGSHWIGIVSEGKKLYIYDSFGRPSERIIPILKRESKSKLIDAEYDPEQVPSETNCGARSLAWLLFFKDYGPKAALTI